MVFYFQLVSIFRSMVIKVALPRPNKLDFEWLNYEDHIDTI
jgi:hypothetical protein